MGSTERTLKRAAFRRTVREMRDMDYSQLSNDEVGSQVKDMIKGAERQHLEAMINVKLNEANQAALQKDDPNEAKKYAEQARRFKQKADSLAAGIETIKSQFKDYLAEDSTKAAPKAPPVSIGR